jgi:hypothetical protein
MNNKSQAFLQNSDFFFFKLITARRTIFVIFILYNNFFFNIRSLKSFYKIVALIILDYSNYCISNNLIQKR